MDLALPVAVRAALREHGVEPSVPLGAGALGLRWSALGPDGRRYVVVHAAGALATPVRARAEALTRLRHPSLARCARILPSTEGVVVLVEAEPGTDLDVLLEARGRLGAGEVVGLLAPVAEALAVLHEAGLVHGDVAPANIVVTEGRAVLVDLLGGADGSERGTPGFVPPWRADSPGPSADLASLGLVARALLGCADPAFAARSATGVLPAREAGSAAEVQAVLGLVERLVADGGDGRHGREVADELRRACPPQPLQAADPAVLTRLGLRRLSGAQDDGLRATSTVRDASARRRGGRHRTSVRRRMTSGHPAVRLTALAAAAAVIAIVLATGPETPSQAAVRLTRERAQALVSRDAVALATVTVPGSAAARADDEALAALPPEVPAQTVDGLAPSWDLDVVVEGSSDCAEDRRCVRVRMVTAVAGARSTERRVVLVLAPEPWRVVEVRDAG